MYRISFPRRLGGDTYFDQSTFAIRAGSLSGTAAITIARSGTTPTSITLGCSAILPAASALKWTGRSQIYSGADGFVTIANAADNAYASLKLTQLILDDSAYLSSPSSGVLKITGSGGLNTRFSSTGASGGYIDGYDTTNAAERWFLGYGGSAGGLSISMVTFGSNAILGFYSNTGKVYVGNSTYDNEVSIGDATHRPSNVFGAIGTFGNSFPVTLIDNRLQMGGTTSSFPALRRSGAQLDVILADASALAVICAKSFYVCDYTYANLPGTPLVGMIACVTDSSVSTWGSTVAAGGANKVLAFYNGTNWTVLGK